MDNLNRSQSNFFSAGPALRLSDQRRQKGWLEAALEDPRSRFVPVWRQRNLLYVSEDGALNGYLVSADDLPADQDLAQQAVLLGDTGGAACFALALECPEEDLQEWLPEGVEARDLRLISPLFDAREGALLAYARAMLYWHQRHQYCGECGSQTRSEEAGHLRVCTNSSCGARQFPRTDPAIIVLLADEDDQRCLLGRQAVWPPAMYSCLAGFVEPGETLEHAVVREVREESGIEVLRARYRSSQPWPFPCSIMLGFSAVARRGPVDLHDQELEEARWFSRADMVAAIQDGSLKVSRPISIAYRLIEEWFDNGSDTPLAEIVRHGLQYPRSTG